MRIREIQVVETETMGMKKSNQAVMWFSHATSLGVRTRASKTSALQRPNSNGGSLAPDASTSLSGCSSCYLQLRSRRLEKPTLLAESKKRQRQKARQSEGVESGGSCRAKSGSRLLVGSVSSGSSGLVTCEGDACFGHNEGFSETEEGVKASFAQNKDCANEERSTRESERVPCSFIRDLETIVSPGSTTRRMSSSSMYYQRGRDNAQRVMPTARELDEFFAYAEQQQQRLFIDKYNFDVANDLPLPGRYEWVRVVQ